MARLILMRHAKSDWADASLSDHDRPLNDRGRRDAPLMADWMIGSESTADWLVHSTARRCIETVELMVAGGLSVSRRVADPELYLATPGTMLHAIQSGYRERSSLMMVGHNPGLSVLSSTLAGRPIDMPTASVCVFENEGDDLGSFSAQPPALIAFMRPKAILKERDVDE